MFPPEFTEILERAERLTYDEAFALSRKYERSPESPAGRARANFERIVKERGLQAQKSEWVGAAGNAVMSAIVAKEFEMSHAEVWRWATQPVLDAAKAFMARDFLHPDDFAVLMAPWASFTAGVQTVGILPSADTTALRVGRESRARRVVSVPWLEERVGVYEKFVQGEVLARPTYAVAYSVIQARGGSFRLTYRGTGFHDYWFETIELPDDWALNGELDLVRRRFKLNGSKLQNFVRRFDDAEEFARAVAELGDE